MVAFQSVEDVRGKTKEEEQVVIEALMLQRAVSMQLDLCGVMDETDDEYGDSSVDSRVPTSTISEDIVFQKS